MFKIWHQDGIIFTRDLLGGGYQRRRRNISEHNSCLTLMREEK
jgi:hypothetical protein